jgi:phosphomannomutase
LAGIKFGTDGWRSIIAEDFTFENVRVVAQAIADYINGTEKDGEGIIVGFDNRFLSEQFAAAVAEVLTGNGIPVFLPERAVPTPVAAFSIRHFKTRGAVMLTASHNPPEYHGIKFIPEFAGPALPEETEVIEANGNTVLASGKIKRMDKEKAQKKDLWHVIDPLADYTRHLLSLVHEEQIRGECLKIIVDPLYGAGMGYVESVLRGLGCRSESIHNYRDAFFGGSMPDPVENNLSQLREKVLETGADLGIALDGDADRFGIIDRTGKFFTPNEILPMLLEHLIVNRKEKGLVARTCATTHMLDRVAGTHGLELEETKVGFKYIGQMLLHHGALLGGEESGGMSIKGHVPEKDGILGACLVIEMATVMGGSLTEIQEQLFSKYGRMVSARLDVSVSPEDKERVVSELAGYSPSRLAGQEAAERIDIDGTKIVAEDGSWVLIRPSGTEPIFRVYTEADSQERLVEIQRQVRRELKI